MPLQVSHITTRGQFTALAPIQDVAFSDPFLGFWVMVRGPEADNLRGMTERNWTAAQADSNSPWDDWGPRHDERDAAYRLY